MFSTTHGGRLCVCGHIKAIHEDGISYCVECDCEGVAPICRRFRDRSPETAPIEEAIPEDQRLRGIAARRIWV
jgi:hypothetical protein